MEDTSGLFIDPDEDEIFFNMITDREAEIKNEKSAQSEVFLLGHRLEGNNEIPDIAGLNLESLDPRNDPETLNRIEQMPDTTLQVNGSNVSVAISDQSSTVEDNALKVTDGINCQEEVTSGGCEKEEINFAIETAPEKDHEICQNEIDLQLQEQNFNNENKICPGSVESNNIAHTDLSFEEGIAHDCKESSADLDEIQITFEQLTTSVKMPMDGFKTEKPVDTSHLIKFDSSLYEVFDKDNELDERKCDKCEDFEKEVEVKRKSNIFILDESLPDQAEEKNVCTLPGIEDERHKKLQRRTLKLLEELRQVVNHENAQGELNLRKETLSEEAAKIIQKLTSVALDNIEESFLGSEDLDLLNDTICNPFESLRNNEIATLLEKIENKFQSQTENIDIDKENLCSNKMNETLNRNNENLKNVKTPLPLKSTPTAQIRNKQKCTSERKCFAENKKTPLLSRINQNRAIAGCRTAEGALKPNLDKRIPELKSTTSKLPMRRNLNFSSKTPIKTPKNVKFNNIESPVQAYINSKAPVVKGKSEPLFNLWPKQTASCSKAAKSVPDVKIPRSEPRKNLPRTENTIPMTLKMGKAPESRLPRLAPKTQKLILGNPLRKQEGRIPVRTDLVRERTKTAAL